MKFSHAKCEICKVSFFKEEEVISYYNSGVSYRDRNMEVVQLNGREPWCGVHCACLGCIEFLANAATQRKEVDHVPNHPIVP